jgi:hypothetical protein
MKYLLKLKLLGYCLKTFQVEFSAGFAVIFEMKDDRGGKVKVKK